MFGSVKSITEMPPWYQAWTKISRPGTGTMEPLWATQFSRADWAGVPKVYDRYNDGNTVAVAEDGKGGATLTFTGKDGKPIGAKTYASPVEFLAEMRREVLVVTTTGVSGLVGQRGEVLDLVPDSVSASGVHAMALRTTATPARVASRWVEYLLAAQGLAGVAWGLWVLGSRRRGGTMDVGSAAPVPVRS